MKSNSKWFVILTVLSFSLNAASFAKTHVAKNPEAPSRKTTHATPACLDDSGNVLPINNAAVIKMKTTTPNQFLARAHVSGTIGNIYPNETGHNHFQAILGPNPGDTIELIYNESFGSLGRLVPGDTVEACGDFINSDAATSQYPVSPDDAIMHWIHKNPSGHGHPSGFTIINGVLDGQGNGSGS